MSDTVKYVLDEGRIPKAWYNIAADLPKALPPVLHPGTKQPIGPDDLAPLFPMELILQEVSTEREIQIPEPGARRLPAMAAARPSTARGASRRRCRPRPASTTSTRASRPPAATSPTPPCRRPSTTSRRA